MVTVLLAPLPPNTMFATGTRVMLVEPPASVSDAAAVSASPMVKGMAEVAVFLFVVWSAISEIVGGVFPTAAVITQVYEAGVASVLPAASVAFTSKA